MIDNICFVFYDVKYEVVLVNRVMDKKDEIVLIVGKCCELGDMFIWDIDLLCVN